MHYAAADYVDGGGWAAVSRLLGLVNTHSAPNSESTKLGMFQNAHMVPRTEETRIRQQHWCGVS